MKLTDEELISAIEAQEASSLDAWSGILSGDRAEALARYRGEPDGTEIEGRSQIVSRDLLDVIEWIMPSLARIFLSGDEVGKFAPLGPQDEEQADIETQVCNWFLMQRNDGFTQLMAAMRDALLLRNGYVLAWWKTDTWKEEERYQGLTQEELAFVLQDKDVKVTEQEAGEGGLFDIVLERNKEDEWVQIEAVPPDEIRVGRRHRMGSLEDADFVQWRHETTIGELRALGYEVDDDAPEAPDAPQEATYRNRFDESQFSGDPVRDPSRRIVICKWNWIRLDLDGTGKQQLWRIGYIDGQKKCLLREKADIVQVAAFTAIGYPHSHVGTSFHDLMSDLASIKQVLMRQLLDNVYVGNNQRLAVDVDRVNVDDLLVSRPGGVIRVQGSLDGALVPIMTPDLTGGLMGALEYVDQVKETRTGISKASAGLDANTLNKTATGVQMLQAAGTQRIELLARTLAGGFTDLFRIVHRLAAKHSTKPIQLEINGKWLPIDPRSWARRTQFSISVGMGTGTPEAQMAKLQAIAQFMAQGAQMGLCGPEEFYGWGEEFLKAAGYRNVGKFLQEPKKDEQGNLLPPPKPSNPMVEVEQAKAQAQGQLEQMKLQAQGQFEQIKAQVTQQVSQAQQAFEMAKLREQLASNERIAAMNNAAKTDIELANMAEQRALNIHKQQNENVRKIADVALEAASLAKDHAQHVDTIDQQDRARHEEHSLRAHEKAADIGDRQQQRQQDASLHQQDAQQKQAESDGSREQLTSLTEAIHTMAKNMSRPKKVTRGADGKATGIE